MRKFIFKPYLLFILLLVFYISIVVFFSKEKFMGDEGRYIEQAINLNNGFYSSKDNISLWNGPGYPFILLFFILFKVNLIYAKILNAFFLLAAVIYFLKTLKFYVNEKVALISSISLGLYYPFYQFIPLLVTEIFAVFLVSAFSYHLLKGYITKKKTQSLYASIFLALLALTKIIYGYVIILFICFLLLLIVLKKNNFKHILYIILLSIIWCLPYLIYTYNLTGKIFYWGNSGGSSLYWMSTPFQNEYGDWRPYTDLEKIPQLKINHEKFFESINKLDNIRRDDAFEEKAIKNIINYPHKYLMNWLANLGRMFFSYPYSYTNQKLSTYFYLPNIFLIFVLLLCIYPLIVVRNKIPVELISLLVFTFFYLFLSSLGSAYARQSFLVLPFFILIITYTISKLDINIKN